jgi:hypothetical protein
VHEKTHVLREREFTVELKNKPCYFGIIIIVSLVFLEIDVVGDLYKFE